MVYRGFEAYVFLCVDGWRFRVPFILGGQVDTAPSAEAATKNCKAMIDRVMIKLRLDLSAPQEIHTMSEEVVDLTPIHTAYASLQVISESFRKAGEARGNLSGDFVIGWVLAALEGEKKALNELAEEMIQEARRSSGKPVEP